MLFFILLALFILGIVIVLTSIKVFTLVLASQELNWWWIPLVSASIWFIFLLFELFGLVYLIKLI